MNKQEQKLRKACNLVREGIDEAMEKRDYNTAREITQMLYNFTFSQYNRFMELEARHPEERGLSKEVDELTEVLDGIKEFLEIIDAYEAGDRKWMKN